MNRLKQSRKRIGCLWHNFGFLTKFFLLEVKCWTFAFVTGVFLIETIAKKVIYFNLRRTSDGRRNCRRRRGGGIEKIYHQDSFRPRYSRVRFDGISLSGARVNRVRHKNNVSKHQRIGTEMSGRTSGAYLLLLYLGCVVAVFAVFAVALITGARALDDTPRDGSVSGEWTRRRVS